MNLLLSAAHLETQHNGNNVQPQQPPASENVHNKINLMEFVAEDHTSTEAAPTTACNNDAKMEDPTHRYVPYKSNTKPRTEEQKLRKKAHNRKSASRYRSKKKQEEEEGSTKLSEIEAQNTSLKGSVDALQK